MSLWSHTLSRAVGSRALIPSSSRLLRISFCNHFHSCRTLCSETVLPAPKDNVSLSKHLTKRHIATASPTMPPRNRKRISAQVEAQDHEPAHVADVPNPSEAASNGPRRSSRRMPASRESPLTKENRTGNAKKRGRVDEMDGDEVLPRRTKSGEDVTKRLGKDDEGPASALQRLEEMEASFKNDIKRRRLQIEQSIVNGANSDQPAPGLKLRGATPSQKGDVFHLTPGKENDRACEIAEDDESEAGDELIETIKGANRPPAVHSDYLPLPWKGRLGYVSFLISRGDNSAEVLMSHLGLPEYLSTHCQAPCLQFKDMPYSIYPRTSAPACRPVATRASYQKQAR